MKGLGAGLKVGLLTLFVAVTGYSLWKAVAEHASGTNGRPLVARFHDAAGLASKSRVVIAGLTIGEIADRQLEGNIAKVTITVQRQIKIYSNAIVYKKSSSLLGEFYIDIDPGTPQSKNPDGTITQNHLLKDGEAILNVQESTGTDQIFRQVSVTIPKFDAALEEITGLAKDIRSIVQHQVNSIASNVDKMVAENAKTVTAILDTAERSLGNIERITADIKKITGKDDLGNTISNLEAATGEAKLLLAEARVELSKTGGIVREKLDKLDKTLDNLARATDSTASITDKIDKDQGTLGRLVNDPTIADNVTDITEDVKTFTSAIGGLQTIVGIRGEYNFFAKSFRSYASIQINTRKDKFYLIEMVSDPNGNISKDLVYDEATDSWDRRYTASDKFRFTFMLGKRFDMVSVRLGIKESSGGVGADLHLFDDDLTVSADVFDWSYRVAPRVKLQLAWRFFQYLYIYAGVDDLLNPRQSLDITGDKIDNEADEWSFGLDFFAGAQLRFTDSDLSSLLFVGGSAIAGLSK
jgi:phospholipid/cholesterol/gamma-HCH transport system substrate-binding protein